MADGDSRKEQLRAELAHARTALSKRSTTVGEALDFKARIRRNVARNKVAWIGGAVLVGFILSRLPVRQPKVRVRKGGGVDPGTAAKTGILLTVAKVLFDAARPALLKVAMNQLQPLIEKAMDRWRPPR